MAKNMADMTNDTDVADSSGGNTAERADNKKIAKSEEKPVKLAKQAKNKAVKAPPKKGIVTRIRQYFKDVAAELKKVHWPARNELLTYTGVVLASVGILAALTWVVDSGLSFVMVELLGR